MKYRRLPTELEGFQLGKEPTPEWFEKLTPTNVGTLEQPMVNYHTEHGNRLALHGDYIMRSGTVVWTVEQEMFEQLYERI